jgi:hypothetical protein
VDRFLQDLDSRGLERPAMRALDVMPGDLTSLYDEILRKCIKNRPSKEFEVLKLIFSWIASCKRPLNLEEVYWLMMLKFGWIMDLEEETANKCARCV